MTGTAARVLVTGASGFVGSAVARTLAGAGYALRLAVRASSPTRNLDGLEAEIAEADLRDAEAVREAARGVRYVVHVAADYRLWAPDPEEIVHNNVLTTRNVMEAALAAGAERIVHTSSVATLGFRADGRPSDETLPLDEAAAVGAYKRSKVAAERLVERMVAERGLPAVIVNPSTPIGPRDVRPTPTGRIIVEAANGRIPAFVDTGLNLVHVDDCAEGHRLALERGRIGERYILGGVDLTLAEMLGEIAELTGRPPPRLRLPRGPLYPLAMISEAVAHVTRREPMLMRDTLDMAAHRMFFDSGKAKRELGYAARDPREGLRDALAWFREAGLVR